MKTTIGHVIVAALISISCGAKGWDSSRSEDEHAALGGEIAARVGGSALPLSVVANVASAQNVSMPEAVRKVVDDEIAASAARVRGLDQRGPAAWRLVSTRARLTSDRLYAEAKGRGLPTDSEVKTVTERHWVEVDRPPTVRVVHALVVRPKNGASIANARALASEIQRAVVGIGNEGFESGATSVEHDPKLQVLAERLPAFTEAGAVPGGAGGMDETFSRAAFAIRSVGETSGVVETGFGFHVIRLLERIPEVRMPIETRRLAFAEEIYLLRARELLGACLERQRASNDVVISPGAERSMSMVPLVPQAASAP